MFVVLAWSASEHNWSGRTTQSVESPSVQIQFHSYAVQALPLLPSAWVPTRYTPWLSWTLAGASMSYFRDGRLVWQGRQRKGRRRQRAKIWIEERKMRRREERKKESKLSFQWWQKANVERENRRRIDGDTALFLSTNFGTCKNRENNLLERNVDIFSLQYVLIFLRARALF